MEESIFDDFCSDIRDGKFTVYGASAGGASGLVHIYRHDDTGKYIVVKTVAEEKEADLKRALLAYTTDETIPRVKKLTDQYKQYTSDFLVHYQPEGETAISFFPIPPSQITTLLDASIQRLSADAFTSDERILSDHIKILRENMETFHKSGRYNLSTYDNFLYTLREYAKMISDSLETLPIDSNPLKDQYRKLGYNYTQFSGMDKFAEMVDLPLDMYFMEDARTHYESGFYLYVYQEIDYVYTELINFLYQVAGPVYNEIDLLPELLRKEVGASENAKYIWSPYYLEFTVAQILESNSPDVHPIHLNSIFGIKLCDEVLKGSFKTPLVDFSGYTREQIQKNADKIWYENKVFDCLKSKATGNLKNCWIEDKRHYQDLMERVSVPFQMVQQYIPSETLFAWGLAMSGSYPAEHPSTQSIFKSFPAQPGAGHALFIQIASLIRNMDASRIIHNDLHVGNILLHLKTFTKKGKRKFGAYKMHPELGQADTFSYQMDGRTYYLPESLVGAFPVIIDFDRAAVFDQDDKLSVFGSFHTGVAITATKADFDGTYEWMEMANLFYFASRSLERMTFALANVFERIYSYEEDDEDLQKHVNHWIKNVVGEPESAERFSPIYMIRKAIVTNNVTVDFFKKNIVQYVDEDTVSKSHSHLSKFGISDAFWEFFVDCIQVLFVYPMTKTSLIPQFGKPGDDEAVMDFYARFIHVEQYDGPFFQLDRKLLLPGLKQNKSKLEEFEKYYNIKAIDEIHSYLQTLGFDSPKGNVVPMV